MKKDLDSKEEGDRLYAAALLELAIVRTPAAPEPYFLLGELRFRQKEDAQAMELLEAALEFGWEPGRSSNLLRQLYLRNGLYGKVRKLCADVVIGQDAGAKNRCLGETYLAERDLEGALVAYSAAVSEAPDVAEGWYDIGVVKEAKKDTEQAVEHYTIALERITILNRQDNAWRP